MFYPGHTLNLKTSSIHGCKNQNQKREQLKRVHPTQMVLSSHIFYSKKHSALEYHKST